MQYAVDEDEDENKEVLRCCCNELKGRAPILEGCYQSRVRASPLYLGVIEERQASPFLSFQPLLRQKKTSIAQGLLGKIIEIKIQIWSKKNVSEPEMKELHYRRAEETYLYIVFIY